MDVLVAYATHHGATREIAERIGATLARSGLRVTVEDAGRAPDAGRYDAVVVGSALYCGWLREASRFIERNRRALAQRPVWLFSSGPLGTATIDADGRDVRAAAVPKEIARVQEQIHPRDHRVFFGAYDPAAEPVGFLERSFRLVPNGQAILHPGDFRDWDEIEGWSAMIARELGAASPSEPAAAGLVPVSEPAGIGR